MTTATAYLIRAPRIDSPRSPGGSVAPVRQWKAQILCGPEEGVAFYLDVPEPSLPYAPEARAAVLAAREESPALCEGLLVTVAYVAEDQFATLVCRLPGNDYAEKRLAAQKVTP
jgi:hypothetical protein